MEMGSGVRWRAGRLQALTRPGGAAKSWLLCRGRPAETKGEKTSTVSRPGGRTLPTPSTYAAHTARGTAAAALRHEGEERERKGEEV